MTVIAVDPAHSPAAYPPAAHPSADHPPAAIVSHRTRPPAGFHRTGDLAWRVLDERLEIVHPFAVDSIRDSVVVDGLVRLVELGVLAGQEEFESAAVGLIRTSAPTESAAWAAFYDNSVAELRSGASPFAPVHARALASIAGREVLEVGCCFGFFALQCADLGHDVTACDISPGAVALLSAAARRRGASVDAVIGDATDLPFGDDSTDTVTLIHLLEHLEPAQVTRALAEALRVARLRVVVAVPYEEHPSEHFGHRTRLAGEDLRRWAATVTHGGVRFVDDHGGWMILTPLGSGNGT